VEHWKVILNKAEGCGQYRFSVLHNTSYCTANVPGHGRISYWTINLAVGEIPAKFWNFYVRCIDDTQTESGTEVLQTQAESKYKFGHTELVFMILNVYYSTSFCAIWCVKNNKCNNNINALHICCTHIDMLTPLMSGV
jgi:hypothetical protein